MAIRIGKIDDWVKGPSRQQIKGMKLKPMQEAIINCNEVRDVLVNLPTGFGKSMLFQYPASFLEEQCIIVFVPLRALLWDCLKEAALLKISASQINDPFINSFSELTELPKLLFLTPERMFRNSRAMATIELLHERGQICKFVIDQAHCISEWGSDFRPDYSELCKLRTFFPNVNILGMSATIPPEARNDLMEKLQMPGCYYFQSSSNRTNLIYEISVTFKKKVCEDIYLYLKEKKLLNQSGIIYCQTIKGSEEVYDNLKNTLKCDVFHSQVPEKKREKLFKSFMDGTTKIIIATICFGMGVNKRDIRFVIHAGVSLSIENYYQESGRAGRDGIISHCRLFTYKEDTNPLYFLIEQSSKTEKMKNRRTFKIQQIKKYATSSECRKKHIFKILGEEFSEESCRKTCDYCLNKENMIEVPYNQFDYTDKGVRIVSELQTTKAYLTKRQLISHLRDKGALSQSKANQKKLQLIRGIMKTEKEENCQALIDTLIELNLLIESNQSFKTGKNRFRSARLIKPCTKVELRNIKKVIVRVKTSSRTHKITETASLPNLKFQKFLLHRTKTEEINAAEEKKKIDKYFQYDQKQSDFERKIQNRIIADEDGTDLNEIKMVTMNEDYLNFFDELFNEGLLNEEKVEEKASFLDNLIPQDYTDLDLQEGQQGQCEMEPQYLESQSQRQERIQMSGLEIKQVSSAINKKNKKSLTACLISTELNKAQKNTKNQSQDQDDFLIMLAKKAKAEREKKQNETIKRKAKKFEFI